MVIGQVTEAEERDFLKRTLDGKFQPQMSFEIGSLFNSEALVDRKRVVAIALGNEFKFNPVVSIEATERKLICRLHIVIPSNANAILVVNMNTLYL